jgi:hypothetical protein
MVLIYPEPSLFTKHTVIGFSEGGICLGEILESNPRLQERAIEYGLRNSNITHFRDFIKKHKIPAGREHSLTLHREAKVSEIRKALEHLLILLRGKVLNVVYERVQSIVLSIQQVLPRLEQADASDHAAYTIREMALTYLPETLENYLKLPRAYARFHPVRDGKTSKELLLEQLAVLDAEMKQVVEDVNRDKVNTLQAHGRFLRSRFGHSDKFIV